MKWDQISAVITALAALAALAIAVIEFYIKRLILSARFSVGVISNTEEHEKVQSIESSLPVLNKRDLAKPISPKSLKKLQKKLREGHELKLPNCKVAFSTNRVILPIIIQNTGKTTADCYSLTIIIENKEIDCVSIEKDKLKILLLNTPDPSALDSKFKRIATNKSLGKVYQDTFEEYWPTISLMGRLESRMCEIFLLTLKIPPKMIKSSLPERFFLIEFSINDSKSFKGTSIFVQRIEF